MGSDTFYGSDPEPSRARHVLVLGAATLVLMVLLGAVVAVVGLVGAGAGGDDDDDSRAASVSTTGGSGERTGKSPGEWETDPNTGLPIAAASREGHPVGFPHTEAGAAAMVVELNRAQIGLDYATALATIGVYAAPEDQAFFDALATSALDQRRTDLGLPTQDAATRANHGDGDGDGDEDRDGVGNGEVIAPAGYAQTPIGYQVQEYGPDYYLVSVLNEVTSTTTHGQINHTTYVGQQFVRWTPGSQPDSRPDSQDGAGDWQLIEPSDTDRDQLLATPVPAVAALGTAAFEEAGWSALLDSSTTGSSPATTRSTTNRTTGTRSGSGTGTGADTEATQ